MNQSPQLDSAKMRQRIDEYYAAVRSLDVDNWGAKFAENVVMEDPVGTPTTHGLEQAKQRYHSAALMFSEVNMFPLEVIVPPLTNEAMVRWSVALRVRETGAVIDNVYGFTHFRFNNDCLIESFRAFWDPSALAAKTHQ